MDDEGPEATPPQQPSAPVVLREMSVGHLLDTAIKLYQAHWKPFIAVAALLTVPYVAVQTVFGSIFRSRFEELAPAAVPTAGDIGALVIGGLLAAGLAFFIGPLVAGALAKTASSIYLGESPTANEALSFAFSRIGALLLISFLYFLTVAGGFILLIVPGIIFMTRLALAPAAFVVEGHKGTKALGRSWELTRGIFGKVFLTIFVSYVISLVVQGILSFPLNLIARAASGPVRDFLIFIGDSLGSVVATPFVTIVAVLLYFDTRIRKEGFDLNLMAQEMGRQQG